MDVSDETLAHVFIHLTDVIKLSVRSLQTRVISRV